MAGLMLVLNAAGWAGMQGWRVTLAITLMPRAARWRRALPSAMPRSSSLPMARRRCGCGLLVLALPEQWGLGV